MTHPASSAHLLDSLQTQFTLLVLGDLERDALPAIRQYLPQLQVRSFSQANDSHRLLSKIWGWQRAYLLRPDGHVLARYASLNAQRIVQDINTLLLGGNHAV